MKAKIMASKKPVLPFILVPLLIIGCIFSGYWVEKSGLASLTSEVSLLQTITKAEVACYNAEYLVTASQRGLNATALAKVQARAKVIQEILNETLVNLGSVNTQPGISNYLFTPSKSPLPGFMAQIYENGRAYITALEQFTQQDITSQIPEVQTNVAALLQQHQVLTKLLMQSRLALKEHIQYSSMHIRWYSTLFSILLVLISIGGIGYLYHSFTKTLYSLEKEKALEKEEVHLLKQKVLSQQTTLQHQLEIMEACCENSPDGLMVLSQDGILYTNSRFDELLELPETLKKAKQLQSLLEHLSAYIQNWGEFSNLFERMKSFPEDKGYTLLEVQGGRYLECYSIPAQLSSDEQKVQIWLFRDSTEFISLCKSYQRRRRNTEVPSPTSFASIFTSTNGKILSADINGLQLFGYDEAEITQLNLRDVLVDSNELALIKLYEETILNKTMLFEATFSRKNGKIFSARVAANYIEVENEPFIELLIQVLEFFKKSQQKREKGEEDPIKKTKNEHVVSS